MEVPDAPRLGHSGRKSPSKRGGSPSKIRESSPSKRESSPSKTKGRQGSRQRKEEKSQSMLTPYKATKSQVEEWAKGSLPKKKTEYFMTSS